MIKEEKSTEELFFESGMNKYRVVHLAIRWIRLKKNEEEYKKLSQADLLDKVLREVLTRKVTAHQIEELEKQREAAKEAKQEENATAN